MMVSRSTLKYLFCLIIFLVLLVPLLSFAAAINFVEHPVAQNYSSNPLHIQAIDMDDDNDLDVVVSGTSWGSGDLAWWENDGNQNFTEHTISQAANWWNHFAVDMDGDGDIDILSRAGYNESSDYRITLWENDGNQNFSPLDIASNWYNHLIVYPSDLDNDGDMDIIVNNYLAISWFENDGSLTFTEHIVEPYFGSYSMVYASDLDGDNDKDILTGASTQEFAWWENDGNQNFTKHIITQNFGILNGLISTPDLDGDGNRDILATNGSRTSWFKNDGFQNFTEYIISYSGDYSNAADIDSDGDMDVLVASLWGEHYWMENDGNQSFTKNLIQSGYSGAMSITTADMDGDFDLDVLGVAYWGRKITWWESDLSLQVRIDIKPGSDPNCFNNNGNGVIPVAVLSDPDFDATQIDPGSVDLDGQSVGVVGKGNILAHIEDSDGDGIDDLVMQIEDVDGTYLDGDSSATLTGNTYDGVFFVGVDSICIVP